MEAGCVRRLKSSQNNASVSPAKAESFFLFRFIGEALTRRSLFLIFQSRFSLLSVLLSLRSPLILLYTSFFFSLFAKSVSAAVLLHLSPFFSITLSQADGQALGHSDPDDTELDQDGFHSEMY